MAEDNTIPESRIAVPQTRIPKNRLENEVNADDKNRILDKKVILQQKILEFENILSEQWDQIVHFADIATREVTSNRIRYELDTPINKIPFILDMIIYIAIGALPFTGAFASAYIGTAVVISKRRRAIIRDHFANKSRIKNLLTQQNKFNQLYKGRHGVKFDMKKYYNSRVNDLSHTQKYIDLIKENKLNSLLSNYTALKIKDAINKGFEKPSVVARKKEYRSIVDTMKSMIMNAANTMEIRFNDDVQFYKEVYDFAELNKRLIKDHFSFEKSAFSANVESIPEEYLDQDIEEVDELLDAIMINHSDNDRLLDHLSFEDATIGGMELIVWARLYTWKYSQKIESLKNVLIIDRDFYPPFNDEQFAYFKNRFIDSGYRIPLGELNESKNQGVKTKDHIKVKVLFYQYMERFSLALLGVQDEMAKKIKIPHDIQ